MPQYVDTGTNACFAPHSGGLDAWHVFHLIADSWLLNTMRGILRHIAEVTKGKDLLFGTETTQGIRALTCVLMSGQGSAGV
jgi:hypothetical protein